MKILFVISKLAFTENIGIAYLSAIAKEDGHKTYFYSLDKLLIEDYVKQIKPDVIAYSCTYFSFNDIVHVNKQLKKLHTFISIMGGSHPTFQPETFKDSGMDAYCIGEGEYAFRDFLKCVEDDISFDGIENLITRTSINSVRPLIDNLNTLPMPDHDLILGNTFLGNMPKKTFFTSRGCSFNCSYCCNSIYKKIYSGKGKLVRRFSVNRVISEIEQVRSKYCMDFVKFSDDCFCIKPDKWLHSFVKEYKMNVDVPFNCILRFDVINDEVLKLLKKAGCHSVTLSVDSIVPRIREDILHRNMNMSNKDIINKLRKIKDFGIETYVNFMLGLPTSTAEDEIDTISFSRNSDVTYPAYTIAVPFEGTELFNYCNENNLIADNYKCGDMLGWSNLKGFSQEQQLVQRNVFLLGALLSKVDENVLKFFYPLLYCLNESLYHSLWQIFFDYNMENVIYKLGEKPGIVD